MLSKYSLGTGDRFGQQGQAQLKAIQKALREDNILITPVWNKSHREHEIIGTGPQDVQKEAKEATKSLDWDQDYFLDADHITREIVDPYIECANFFTLDVADYIGEKAEASARDSFFSINKQLIGTLSIPGISEEFTVTESFLLQWANQYLTAIEEAGELYRYISSRKGTEEVVFEISIDEVDTPQTPIELFFILKTVAEHEIPINTIAPKFTGQFYKGIDYVGDIDQFVTEFEHDILVIAYAIQEFGLPDDLKLSIHSGSDKFSLYPHIHRLIKKHQVGIHLKTSGTTWLEELIGLAMSGSKCLAMVQDIYREAYRRYEELTAPYQTVINIDQSHLPVPEVFNKCSAQKIVSILEHGTETAEFDPQLRQFLHCSYKIAAEKGDHFLKLLQQNKEQIGGRVTNNLFERHIKPLFFNKQK